MAKAGGTPGKRRGIRLADRELIELADPRVQHMPVADCGESLIDVAKSGIIAYGSPPECPETAPFYRMLREEVVNRLEKAQQRLPTGLQFRLHSKATRVGGVIRQERLRQCTKFWYTQIR